MNKLYSAFVAVGLSVGAAGAHAQALTSATTIVAENPTLVGIGAAVGTVQVSSSVATTLTLQMPNYRNIVGRPLCVTYNIANEGPKPLTYTYNATTGVVTVGGSTMTSGTLAVSDQVTCNAVYRP